jgi:transposase
MEKRVVKIKRCKYDKGFKEEALRMVANGRSVPEVARTIGIGENLLYKWRTEFDSKRILASRFSMNLE